MTVKRSMWQRTLTGSVLILSALMMGCSQQDTSQLSPEHAIGGGLLDGSYKPGKGSIRGMVIDQNAGAPVPFALVTMYQNGKSVARLRTGFDGSFNVRKMAAGTYDFQVRKPGMAGSDVYGLVVGEEPTDLRIVQRIAFDVSAAATPPKLVLTRGDGTTPLANAEFTDGVDMRVATADNSDHLPPMRVLWAQLGRTPGSGAMQGGANHGGWVFQPKNTEIGKVDSGELKLPSAAAPNFIAGFGSAEGEKIYMEVIGVDFNYNMVRYIVPITLKSTAATLQNTVVAPTAAAATAITVRYEGGTFTTPYAVPKETEVGALVGSGPSALAAPTGSNMFVELRWCYTNTDASAKPFAFEIERSLDGGQNYKLIGKTGGAANKDCSNDQSARPFFFKDNGVDLAVGKKAMYRVVARGANTEKSAVTQTTPLGQFDPTLLSPRDEKFEVPIHPTFVLGSNQRALGADGTGYNLRLKDLKDFTGVYMPGTSVDALIRVEEGTGEQGNKIPVGESLVFAQGGPLLTAPREGETVLTDTAGVYNKAKPNLVPVNTQQHTVSLPLSIFSEKPLQTQRRYTVELYSALAYKYDPAEGNRVSAYSVYTWPDATKAPIRIGRSVTDVYDFTTGTK